MGIFFSQRGLRNAPLQHYTPAPPVSMCECVFGSPPGTPSLSSSLWPSLILFSLCILPMFGSPCDWNNKASSFLQALTQFQAVMFSFIPLDYVVVSCSVYAGWNSGSYARLKVFFFDDGGYDLRTKNTKHQVVADSQYALGGLWNGSDSGNTIRCQLVRVNVRYSLTSCE